MPIGLDHSDNDSNSVFVLIPMTKDNNHNRHHEGAEELMSESRPVLCGNSDAGICSVRVMLSWGDRGVAPPERAPKVRQASNVTHVEQPPKATQRIICLPSTRLTMGHMLSSHLKLPEELCVFPPEH